MKYHHRIFLIAIVVYVITAFFSTGYFHSDEHYQIIEFAGVLDGTNAPEDMAWEYSKNMRSSIQPLLAHGIFQACKLLGVTDPYSKTFILRLITALFSLVVINFFAGSLRKEIPPAYWKLFLVLSYFLWFLPFINVRFSSETWSGMLFLLSVGLVIRDHRDSRSYIIIGGLLGLSFLFRYQIAFAVLGLFLWLLFIRKERVPKLIITGIAFLFMLLIGIGLDTWYYGKWTVCLWNYFVINLVEGRAAGFGISPWYDYFFLIFRYAFFPIGAVLLLSLVVVVVKCHKWLIVWIIVSFLLGHSLISHKELRFLFPLVNLAPIIIIYAIDALKLRDRTVVIKKISTGILILLLSINIISLVIVSFKPAGRGWERVTKKIQEYNTNEHLVVIHTSNCNPYAPLIVPSNFYKESNASIFYIGWISEEEILAFGDNASVVLVFSQSDTKNEAVQELISNLNMKELCNSIPRFLVPFLDIYGYNTDEVLIVYGSKL